MGNHESLTKLEIGISRTDVVESTHETFHKSARPACMEAEVCITILTDCKSKRYYPVNLSRVRRR